MSATDPVHEIAVRKVKPGRASQFRDRRAAFVTLLTQQPGTRDDREFASFMALPQPDDAEVFVGMTTYESLEANAKIQRNPRVLWRFLRFARTMDLKAYVYVEPTEGPTFDLGTLASAPGQVLELAVRRVKDSARFQSSRRAFLEMLSSQPGVGESWEFAVVKGKDAERLAVGMTVYENREALEAVLAVSLGHPVTTAYFDTFEPVAIQYLTATANH